ncbi:hypothetical protein B0A55_05955 [Friedmanniomyces simplex]|uniref:F-box domain-containing protein n=1 Tax=Friedmanniomyces simplex TaxID=329884 RepID=A0A4U0XBH8_9PEZI|nr:hypothetical protein B0A55_05955 [Friedmanniomyces simplex]
MHDQNQSILFTLPAELREDIYRRCLTAQRPITNPATTLLVAAIDKDIPTLGVPLLRTCRRIYDEMDTSILYAANTFRFTRPMICSWFLNHISTAHRVRVRGITCDLREIDYHGCGIPAGPSGITLGSEWQHYLRCHPRAHDDSRECIYQPQMLVVDMPIIETLTLDVTALQDLAETYANTIFLRRAIQTMLYSLLWDFHMSHCAEGWLADSMEIRIVGRDLGGEITQLRLGPGYLRPRLDGPPDIELDLVRKLAFTGVDSRSGRLLPSLYHSAGCKVATISCVPGDSDDQGSLILSENRKYLHWTEAETDTMWLARTITISEVRQVMTGPETDPQLRLMVFAEEDRHVFVFTSRDNVQEEYHAVRRLLWEGVAGNQEEGATGR